MKRFVVAALMPLVFLVGCGAEAEEFSGTVENPDNYSVINSNDSEVEVMVKEIDGVKCRIAVVYLSVAIDCEEPTKENVFQ